jgi:hypothetical protein
MNKHIFSQSVALALLGMAGLGGCVPAVGDFGRPVPSAWNDDVLPKVGNWAAKRRGEPVSRFPMTDDERDLRNRAWRFIMPAQPQTDFEARLIELRRARIVPAERGRIKRDTYGRQLLAQPYASSVTRYRRLIDDIMEDRQQLAAFFAMSDRVRETDRIRERSLGYIRSQPDDAREQALMRITENQMVTWWVYDALAARVESYRYALERLVVETPEAEAVNAERALMALESDIRMFNSSVGQPRFYDGVLYSK